eukprot:3313740-Amphidinium_carterae.1
MNRWHLRQDIDADLCTNLFLLLPFQIAYDAHVLNLMQGQATANHTLVVRVALISSCQRLVGDRPGLC